jgi:dTDP-4-dehydrorhamnose reductase
VFFGNDKNPGPFSENEPLPNILNGMSWYGWTKVLSEREVGKGGAIVRLSKPLQCLSHERLNLLWLDKRDYLGKLLFEYENHMLAGLMHDQYFPVVSMDEVVQLLNWIIIHKSPGIYHAASPDVTSPFKLLRYALSVMSDAKSDMPQSISFDEFMKTQEMPLRHQKYSAIESQGTTKKTGIQFRGWKQVVKRSLEL